MAKLTEAQVDAAYRMFYGEGLNLGQVAERLGCGIYTLSPWLYRAAMRIAREAVRDDRKERAGLSAAPELTSTEDGADA